MKQHTPGPWRLWKRTAEQGGNLITDASGKTGIARVILSGNPADEAEGNSHLLTASAELLAAAREAQCGCSVRERASGHLSGCWMPDLLAAIAKAEGRS